jgi:hypothetical protein
MNERLHHHLHPDVQKALKMVQRACGKEPIIKQVDDLPHNTRAVLVRPVVSSRPYGIRYRRGEERVLDHLVTHEVGHIIRLHSVPEEDRLAAVISLECRVRAARQLAAAGELNPLLARGMSPDTVEDLMGEWHEALAIQVANGHADLRIEQWIHDRFPGLRRVQERSLTEEVRRGDDAFHPLVRQLVPTSVYWPMLAMNAAQAVHVSRLFQKPEILRPFNTQQVTGLGEHLTGLVLSAPDEGHRSDMATTTRWAEELGLMGWLEWQPYTHIYGTS